MSLLYALQYFSGDGNCYVNRLVCHDKAAIFRATCQLRACDGPNLDCDAAGDCMRIVEYTCDPSGVVDLQLNSTRVLADDAKIREYEASLKAIDDANEAMRRVVDGAPVAVA